MEPRKHTLLRVTQLDAVQLDEEITKIFKNIFENAIKYLPPGITVPFEPEINLIIKLLILNYSVIKNNATFGQKLLLIRYDNLTLRKKLLYLLLSSGDYLQCRLESMKSFKKFHGLFSKLEFVVYVLDFINLSVFLRAGVKPKLIDRILDLDQVYEKNFVPRFFGDKYLARELLWNGFIEFLVFTIPLINYHKLRRIFRNIFSGKKKTVTGSNVRIYNKFSKCPHCLNSPILPHHMGCPHVFCYVCLKSNLMADFRYECPLCQFSGKGVCEQVAVY